MSPLTLSVLLSLVSALCYASAAIVQERIAATTAPSRLGLLRSARWWLAVALQGAGALLHVVALGLGPLTVVQPLGVLTLVLAAPMAALLVKRPVSAASWRGIALVSVGLAGILLLTGSDGAGSLDGEQQITLAAAVLVTVGVLAVAGRAVLGMTRGGGRGPALRSVSLALAAGIAYGAASVFVKTVTEEWDASSLFTVVPLLALIAVLAAAGLATSQASYRGGGLAAPLATTTVANPVVAAAAGIALLGESFRYGTTGAVAALGAGALASWGLVMLAADSARRLRGAEPSGAEPVSAGTASAVRGVVRQGASAEPGTPVVIPAPPGPNGSAGASRHAKALLATLAPPESRRRGHHCSH
ncbi:DMT family transporter [Streptomyces sp. NPDC048172]|uniref:DMT family transporter n=1 Tax=Streptomyces sp. NPDC048172 TaxID=3365505 RepID=UPI00371FB163